MPAASPAAAVDATAASAPVVYGARRRDVPEENLWEGSYSPKAMLGTLIGAAVVSVLLIAAAIVFRNELWLAAASVGALVALWLAVAWRFATQRLGVDYKLTNQMFYHQRGVLTRVTNRIEVIDIDDITYVQGLFDRMANVGNIKISSSDQTNPTFWTYGVENVAHVSQMIDKARRAERIRRGVSVESLTPQAQPPS